MIDIAIENRVARLVLQRPAASNAFTTEMLSQLLAALTRAAGEADILAISAAGADFSLGRDRQDAKAGGAPFEAFKLITEVNSALSNFPGIAVCSVQGRAFGFAVGMVMRSDIALAAADARFMLDEVKLGIAPMFIMAEISEHLAPKAALDIVLSSREFGAAEAKEIGLVSRVVPDLHREIESLLQDLRSREPEVLKTSKRYFGAVRRLAPEARSAYALVEQTRFAERRKH
ncbi:MAG TPA: enoyl-CoA hydratase/isomerase family protein [Burkholderiales bacterium]|nr:enoyl-CoA hydratase/isomerase family protein [Burkholderiales bacterium]